MQEEKAREWEKGTAEPIPFNKYEKFKEKLAAYSTRYRERNVMCYDGKRQITPRLPYPPNVLYNRV